MSQRWRAVGNTASYSTGPRFEPQTSSFRDKPVTAHSTNWPIRSIFTPCFSVLVFLIQALNLICYLGTYVTFNCVVENETQSVPRDITSSPQQDTSAAIQPKEGDYVELSALEQARSSRQGSNKSSSSAASMRSSKSDLRILEFDYVTMPNAKKVEKYSQLGSVNLEPKQWSETYDIIIR